MNFFFDANVSQYLTRGVRELSAITPGVDLVVHLTDRFHRSAADLAWIAELGGDGPWRIVSIDNFTNQHGAERRAIKDAGHTAFILDGQWAEQGFWPQAERFIRWWPEMIDFANRVAGGIYRVPWHHSSGGKFSRLQS
jgi:hypothetical protein